MATSSSRLRIIGWAALSCLFMYGALANLEKFAARPVAPTDWSDATAADADRLAGQLTVQTGQARSKVAEEHVWALLEAGKRVDGHDAAAAIEPVRPSPSGYDSAYAHRLQLLACAELMHDRAADMLVTLQDLYRYDSEHLPAADARLVHDRANLGLACFLVGESSNDQAYRYDLFKQASDWMQQSLKDANSSPLVDSISIKENQLMLAEAVKDRKETDRLRREVEELLLQLKGSAPIVFM